MARIEPDSVLGHPVPLAEGERLVAEFRADPMAYWRAHLIMAVILGAVAGLILLWQGNAFPVVGPVAAVLAIGARAAYIASEALAEVWRLTDRRLLGPGGRAIPLAQVQAARPVSGRGAGRDPVGRQAPDEVSGRCGRRRRAPACRCGPQGPWQWLSWHPFPVPMETR
jgi:hypothetical protein